MKNGLFALFLLIQLGFLNDCAIAETEGSLLAEGSDPASLQAKLQALEDEINKFRSMMDQTKDQRSNLENTLETNEKDINAILKKIKDLEQDLKKGEDKITDLRIKESNLLDQKVNQQDYIAQQIRASYALGNQQYLKVILNQENPNELSRMLVYYDYFNQARIEQIHTYEATLLDIANIEVQINLQNQKLLLKTAQLDKEQSGLIVVQTKNQNVLKSLNLEIAAAGSAIEKRILDREHLESLLEHITLGIGTFGIDRAGMNQNAQPFRTQKGSLLLPTIGKITHKFGSTRSEGKLRWDGIFIQANEGESVHSVHYGQVVFSDWLRGFGLLLIINHGEGYMSLYGHNQVLYRATGDWVAEGELIADVGNSGGQTNTGLYFEIRNAGKPSNPQQWCQVRLSTKAA